MTASLSTSIVAPVTLGHKVGSAGLHAATTRPRRPLPLPPPIAQRTTACVYGLAALDVHGRVADRVVSAALGWRAGLRLGIRHTAGLLLVRADGDGDITVTRQGHLRLPALIRHQCGLRAGDRVLLAAEPDRRRLLVVPPAALDTFLTRQCSDLFGGESVSMPVRQS